MSMKTISLTEAELMALFNFLGENSSEGADENLDSAYQKLKETLEKPNE